MNTGNSLRTNPQNVINCEAERKEGSGLLLLLMSFKWGIIIVNLCLWSEPKVVVFLIGCRLCNPADGGGRVAGQLQAKQEGGAAGPLKLCCSILRMQRSEIKGEREREPHRVSGRRGVRVEEIIFPFRAQAMINSQLLISLHGNNAVVAFTSTSCWWLTRALGNKLWLNSERRRRGNVKWNVNDAFCHCLTKKNLLFCRCDHWGDVWQSTECWHY